MEKGKLVLREQHHYYYLVQGQVAGYLNTLESGATFVVVTNAGISIQRIFLDEIFWTCMASKLKGFYSTAVVPKLANIL